jgi:hypothetical protein
MDIEEDKKVTKLRMQNQVMTEQLQAINHQIDLYVKNHLKQSKLDIFTNLRCIRKLRVKT